MMFYNGFNLLIDLIIGSIVGLLTYKAAWWRGYEAGVADESYAHLSHQSYRLSQHKDID